MANSLDVYTPALFIIGALVVIFLILKHTKFKGFKEFQEQKLEKTFYDNLKKKINTQGKKFGRKGTLWINFNKIANIDRYIYVNKAFPKWTYDFKSREYIVSTEPKDIEVGKLFILRAKSENIIFQLLGMKKTYYVFDISDKDYLKFDLKDNRFIINGNPSIESYGNVWFFGKHSAEYLDEVSAWRQIQQQQTHLENTPDRSVHLEIEQAKRERTARIISEIEKQKYEERKNAGDSTVM